jgi:hypothetical protein
LAVQPLTGSLRGAMGKRRRQALGGQLGLGGELG